MKKYKFFIKKTCISQNGKRLDKSIAEIFPEYSRNKIKKFIINNQVKVNDICIINPKKNIKGGECIKIKISKKNNLISKKRKTYKLIYEDDDILVINKYKDVIVHPGCDKHENTLLHDILFNYPDSKNLYRAGIVHRLDKDTTGLMLIARNSFSQKKLIKLLKLRLINREYRAVLLGKIICDGTVSAPIIRNSKNRTRMKVHISGKESITHYKIIKNFNDFSYVKINLESGRTHQIRLHMSYINHPVLGDFVYGNKKNKYIKTLYKSIFNISRHALHARKIKFIHPINNCLMVHKIDLPDDMKILLKNLKYLNKI
ncbi:rluD [Wigglesworthia glossinidia endosymbiont of Glossina brevipalpis]|uniref:Pseudouridine synthase n=1 Tax=Wigglesworthia glossinidia brevipalpis TaxID=36870 RepID=Q8D220_WIGBR|nr:rluD [Wigglesworthia glossinidia endosymbiont of Glossina brevipalpis]